MEGNCRECGDSYEINYHLNDGFCDDCREHLNLNKEPISLPMPDAFRAKADIRVVRYCKIRAENIQDAEKGAIALIAKEVKACVPPPWFETVKYMAAINQSGALENVVPNLYSSANQIPGLHFPVIVSAFFSVEVGVFGHTDYDATKAAKEFIETTYKLGSFDEFYINISGLKRISDWGYD